MTARLVRVALFVVMVAAASPVAAADPTLGARLSPAEYVVGQHDAVSITNRGNVPVVVHVDTAGDGWGVDVSDFTLDPDQERSVAVTAGEGEATIRARLTPILATVAMDTAALVLETNARHPAPWEAVPGSLWLLLALAALVASWAVLRRLRAS